MVDVVDFQVENLSEAGSLLNLEGLSLTGGEPLLHFHVNHAGEGEVWCGAGLFYSLEITQGTGGVGNCGRGFVSVIITMISMTMRGFFLFQVGGTHQYSV